MLRLRGLPELMALGIWTFFHQPLASDRHFDAVQDCIRRVFPCGRHGRGGGSTGVFTPSGPSGQSL